MDLLPEGEGKDQPIWFLSITGVGAEDAFVDFCSKSHRFVGYILNGPNVLCSMRDDRNLPIPS